MEPFTLRQARLSDISALDHLFKRSYAQLLAADYPPSVLALAVPIMGRAQPELIRSGRFHVVTDKGRLIGAAGWSFETPGSGRIQPGIGHLRHVATDPDATRQGVGQLLMSRILSEMKAADLKVAQSQSSRTAEPFYRAMGFKALGAGQVLFGGSVRFDTVLMRRDL